MNAFIIAIFVIAFGLLALNLLSVKRNNRQGWFNFTPPPQPEDHEHDDDLQQRGAAMSRTQL